MNLYSKKQWWKITLFIAALTIIGATLWYSSYIVHQIQKEEKEKIKVWSEAIKKKATLVNITNNLFDRLRIEERHKVELWADATKQLANSDIGDDISFLLEVVQGNETVPIILVDINGKPLSFRNISISQDSIFTAIKNKFPWFKLPVSTNPGNKDSLLQIILKFFPNFDYDSYYKNYKEASSDSLQKYTQTWGNIYHPIEVEIAPNKIQKVYYSDSKIFTELKHKRDSLIQSFNEELVDNSVLVPVLFTDSSMTLVIATNLKNIVRDSADFVYSTAMKMKTANEPIIIDIDKTAKGYVFYEESNVLKQLRYYPYIMFSIIGLFLLISYVLFSTFRKAEQNQVWVGLAKETAHQLGTPLSSLLAWIEVLKLQGVDDSTLLELRKDIGRLETITDRFSKIGAIPKISPEFVLPVIEETVKYLQTRVSKNVSLEVHASGKEKAMLNISLFKWVLENLIKNAIDAMDGKGAIKIRVQQLKTFVQIDLTDTGKGIPSGKQSTVFEPGYTTKQRGWGLGLSLTKRIVANYHSGKIFVWKSEIGKGTTFRILLKNPE